MFGDGTANAAGRVGPVLSSGRVADAIVAAIRDQHPDVEVTDRGSYLRVLVPGRCQVTSAAIAAELGGPFRLPRDLERVMPSFLGRFQVSTAEASWSAAGAGGTAGGARAGTEQPE